jgi:Acyl-CoA thioesterase N-terminal domain
MSTAPVFEGSDGRVVATDLARGPWDPGALHGGAPAALLMREFARLPSPDGLLLSRVTYEFMRPVPVGPPPAPEAELVVDERHRVTSVETP